jgi:hypothetical protein
MPALLNCPEDTYSVGLVKGIVLLYLFFNKIDKISCFIQYLSGAEALRAGGQTPLTSILINY